MANTWSTSSVFLVLWLFYCILSVSRRPETPSDFKGDGNNAGKGNGPKSKPNCDWVIVENRPNAFEPINICWALSGMSFKYEYDENTKLFITKQFDNLECTGDFHEVYEPAPVIEANINTGFLCETYAYTAPLRKLAFDGLWQTQQWSASQSIGTGVFNDCNRRFGDIYHSYISCDYSTNTITYGMYQDDKCEVLLPSDDEWYPYKINKPDEDQCIKILYKSTFSAGDAYLRAAVSVKYYSEWISEDVVCTKRRPYSSKKSAAVQISNNHNDLNDVHHDGSGLSETEILSYNVLISILSTILVISVCLTIYYLVQKAKTNNKSINY